MEENWFSKYGVLWYVGPTHDPKTGQNFGVNVLGPRCIKKNCRAELKEKPLRVIAGRKLQFGELFCPLCKEQYTLNTLLLVARAELLNEYQSRAFRGDNIKVVDLDARKKYVKKVETDSKWLEIRAETKGENLETVHIFIGDKRKDGSHTHLIVSGKTGEIRVDEKDISPEEMVSAIKATTTVKGKKRKASIEFPQE